MKTASKKLKTKAWPDGRAWPAELVLDVGSSMPTDVYGIDNPSALGVLYIRHDVASDARKDLEQERDTLQRSNAALSMKLAAASLVMQGSPDAQCKIQAEKIAELSAQVERLRAALGDLSLTCTCTRPPEATADGGFRVPGNHTARCVRTRALAALSLTPSDALKEIRLEVLRYALGIVDGRRVLNRTPDYIAALDDIKIFLEASVERVSVGESMHATAVTQ